MLRTWRNIMAIRSYTEHPLTCLIWAKTLMEGRPRDNFTRNQGSLNCFQWSLMLVLVEHGNGLSLVVVKLSGSARRSARTSSPSHTVVIAQSVYRSPTGSHRRRGGTHQRRRRLIMRCLQIGELSLVKGHETRYS